MNSFYLVPMLIALFISLYALSTLQVRRKILIMDRPFDNEFSNELYALSFGKPFCWLIEEDSNHRKVKTITKNLAEAGLADRLNYRAFMTIQTALMIACFVLGLCFLIFFEQANWFLEILFNISFVVEGADNQQAPIIVFCVLMLLSYTPQFYIRQRAKSNNFNFKKDLPVLQLFILQMLRANNTTGEVIYLMSKIDTRYQQIFATGYRIYTRNTAEGFQYLRNSFSGTKFEETISILEDFHQFSREESFKVLLNVSKDIDDQLASLKKSKATGAMLLAEGSIFLPLLAVLFLMFIPVIIGATSLISQAQQGNIVSL